ncbi:MAG: tetratricopeptide repeat protein [Rhizobiaceae bacterium]|nr:tetratricopeptide repeat protein [Rhizobiaceae bacterium]
MKTTAMLPAFICLMALPLLTSASMAAGEGGGGSNPTVSQCKKGEVWDKKKQKCVKAQRGATDDESIYEAGRDLANAERYQEAIDILELAANPNDPRILNYLGYSNRKLGHVELGLKYYQAALAEKPDYTLVREYLGEAHLQMGNLPAAKEQLAEIERLCGGTSCEEYRDLAEEIEAFEKKG